MRCSRTLFLQVNRGDGMKVAGTIRIRLDTEPDLMIYSKQARELVQTGSPAFILTDYLEEI